MSSCIQSSLCQHQRRKETKEGALGGTIRSERSAVRHHLGTFPVGTAVPFVQPASPTERAALALQAAESWPRTPTERGGSREWASSSGNGEPSSGSTPLRALDSSHLKAVVRTSSSIRSALRLCSFASGLAFSRRDRDSEAGQGTFLGQHLSVLVLPSYAGLVCHSSTINSSPYAQAICGARHDKDRLRAHARAL